MNQWTGPFGNAAADYESNYRRLEQQVLRACLSDVCRRVSVGIRPARPPAIARALHVSELLVERALSGDGISVFLRSQLIQYTGMSLQKMSEEYGPALMPVARRERLIAS